MGWFGKTTWADKVRMAYDTFEDEGKRILFPQGKQDAEEIIRALAERCGKNPEDCSARECEALLNVYAEYAAGKVFENQSREEIIHTWMTKHKNTIWSNGMADRVCNYCEQKFVLPEEEEEPEASVFTVSQEEETLFPEPEEAEEEEEPEEDVAEAEAEEDAEEPDEPEEKDESTPPEPVDQPEPDSDESAEESDPRESIREVVRQIALTTGLDPDHPLTEEMKPYRKNLIKGILKEIPENGSAAVRAAMGAAEMAAEAYQKDPMIFWDPEKTVWKVLKKDLGQEPFLLAMKVEENPVTAGMAEALIRATDLEAGWNELDREDRKTVLKAACDLGFMKAGK